MFRLLWRIREYEIPSHILKTLQFSLYAATGYSGVSFLDSSVGEIVSVKGASMSPTLSPEAKSSGRKDKVLVTRRATIDRGDVVVFTNPTNPDGHGIKRVIGLPGDTIMRDIRRIGIQEEKGYTGAKQLGMAKLGPVVIVPQGSVWVEGDNWRESQDSNYYGPVSYLRRVVV